MSHLCNNKKTKSNIKNQNYELCNEIYAFSGVDCYDETLDEKGVINAIF